MNLNVLKFVYLFIALKVFNLRVLFNSLKRLLIKA